MTKTNNPQSIIFAFLRAFAIIAFVHYALVYLFPPQPPASSSLVTPSSNDMMNTTLDQQQQSQGEVEISSNGEVIAESTPRQPKKIKKKKEPKIKIVKIPKEEKVIKHVKRTTLSPTQQEELEKAKAALEPEELPTTKTFETVQTILELQSKRNVELENMVQEVERLNERVAEMKSHVTKDDESEVEEDKIPAVVLHTFMNEITPLLQLKSFSGIENDEELKRLIENASRQIQRIMDDTIALGDNEKEVRVLDVLDQIWDVSNVKMKDFDESLTCDTSFLMRELSVEDDDIDTPVGDGGDDDEEEEDEVIEEGIARESDMNVIVEQIKALIQNRQKFLQQQITDDDESKLSPLMERGTNHFHKVVYQNFQRTMAKETAVREQSRNENSAREAEADQAMENRIAQFKIQQQQRSCAQPDMVRSMVTQGLDALYKKKDLASSILSVTPLGEKQSPQQLDKVDFDDYAYFVDESLTSNLSSSWKHRGSLRQSFDKPLLYKSLSGLDKLLEYVEGHNDHLDHLIDTIANWGTDNEERFNNPDSYDGSVGKTAGKALLDVLGKMKIPTEGDVPEQAMQMKEKAGILVNGV